jgi:hypothetical protein
MYDLVLKGGTVLDPSTGLDGAQDVAIQGSCESSPGRGAWCHMGSPGPVRARLWQGLRPPSRQA